MRSRSGRVISAYSPTEPARQASFGVLVEFGLLQQLGQLVGEVFVDDLQLGDAVLVVERDGGAVLDGVAEVVDADVVAELLAGQLLPGDQRCAGEAHEGSIGKRRRMLSASVSYWLRCASSVITMMSSRSEQHRHRRLAAACRAGTCGSA